MTSLARRAALDALVDVDELPLAGFAERPPSLRALAADERWTTLQRVEREHERVPRRSSLAGERDAGEHADANDAESLVSSPPTLSSSSPADTTPALFVDDARAELFDSVARAREQQYDKNVETYVGCVRVPLGVAGPVLVRGENVRGWFYVPLATTEAALVASLSRGLRAMSDAGGVETHYVDEGTTRVPCFECTSLADVRRVCTWLATPAVREALHTETHAASQRARLLEVRTLVEGVRVHVRLDFFTGEASGQNMVTFAGERIAKFIVANAPVHFASSVLDAGGSSDKKGSVQSLGSVRGRKVVAHCTLPSTVVAAVLKTDAQRLVEHRTRAHAVHSMIGALGSNSHAANTLAAMYIALGQDPACVAESHAVMTFFKAIAEPQLDNGGETTYALQATMTMPSVLVGTVGGGTALPSQRACLRLLGVDRGSRPGAARGVAEIVAAVALAGELSISAAFTSDTFARAHYSLSRHGSKAKL